MDFTWRVILNEVKDLPDSIVSRRSFVPLFGGTQDDNPEKTTFFNSLKKDGSNRRRKIFKIYFRVPLKTQQ